MREVSRSIQTLECNSVVLGSLPKGCTMCRRGEKAVIFITGLCPINCFYCPISFERKGKDVVYVNEAKVNSIDNVIAEIENTRALGCSITGGEPLVVLSRVLEYIRVLKDYFGSKFHIHLYTSAYRMTTNIIKDFEKSGLDEIRFHIIYLKPTIKVIEYTVKNSSMDVGVEIPVIPGRKLFYIKLLKILDSIGIDFINLNELEITESNCNELLLRGFKARRDYPIGVEGSEELALELVRWAKDNLRNISVHYCSALFKDAIQTRRRLLRASIFVRKPYEDVTEDGLLRKLVVKGPRDVLEKLKNIISRELGRDQVDLIVRGNSCELHTSISALNLLVRVNSEIKHRIRVFEVEEYPTSVRVRVLEELYTLE